MVKIRPIGILLTLLGAAIASGSWLAGAYTLGLVGQGMLALGLVLYGLDRRSLTSWILISMVLGALVGHHWPEVGQGLRLLSQIFLRMIKTIIAPLIFSTLVVGIAGHSNLRQVGRMGVKALVYFEVVTTIALFIGLAAINISKAGVGVVAPPAMEQTNITVVKADGGRYGAALVPGEHREGGGRGPGAAGGGVQHPVRHRPRATAPRQARAAAGGDRCGWPRRCSSSPTSS